jgi:hypothetical protein
MPLKLKLHVPLHSQLQLQSKGWFSKSSQTGHVAARSHTNTKADAQTMDRPSLPP